MTTVYTVVAYQDRPHSSGGPYALYVGHHHLNAKDCPFCKLSQCATPAACSRADLAAREAEYGHRDLVRYRRIENSFRVKPGAQLYRKAHFAVYTALGLKW